MTTTEQNLIEDSIEIRLLKKRIARLQELLIEALPYLQRDYDRAGVGFGKHALYLMNEIKNMVEINE